MIYLIAVVFSPREPLHIFKPSDSETVPWLKLRQLRHETVPTSESIHSIMQWYLLSDKYSTSPALVWHLKAFWDLNHPLCAWRDTCIISSPSLSLGFYLWKQLQSTCNEKRHACIQSAPSRGSEGYGWTNNPISKVKNTQIINRSGVMFNFQDGITRCYP